VYNRVEIYRKINDNKRLWNRADLMHRAAAIDAAQIMAFMLPAEALLYN
jgi:hypothetical protein